jgi:hypothetical protein
MKNIYIVKTKLITFVINHSTQMSANILNLYVWILSNNHVHYDTSDTNRMKSSDQLIVASIDSFIEISRYFPPYFKWPNVDVVLNKFYRYLYQGYTYNPTLDKI